MTHKKRLSKKQIGILWMTIPFFVLMLVISLYAISSYIIIATVAGGVTEAGGFSFLRILLGIFGFLSVIGVVVGIPVGLYFFSRVEPHEVVNLARRSAYEHLSESQVEYIAKWSWSAFFMHWIWTLSNRGVRFWTIAFFAPFIQQYMWVKMAMHGRRMSWESGEWKTFKEFRKRQTILAWVAWVCSFVGVVLFFVLIAWIPGQVFRTMFSNGLQPQTLETSLGTSSALKAEISTRSSSCEDLLDMDEDGLIDTYEMSLGADPKRTDTDGDGFTDGEELESGYDPGGHGEMTDKQKLLYPIHQKQMKRCL